MIFTAQNWKPRKIKLVPTKEKLTDACGLGSMVEVFDQSSLSESFKKCLPKRESNNSYGSYRLGLIQLSSFLYGHDCLDDLEEFRDDPALEAIMRGETVTPRAMGDFLRDFSNEKINDLNVYLSKMAFSIRGQLQKVQDNNHKPDSVIHLSIDSTSHEQHGKKTEGCAWNYEGKWCLDSQEIYDELGLSYGFQLRPGNTKSGVNASDLIKQAFWWKKNKFKQQAWLSGDAAYCYEAPMRTCISLGVTFTFTANQATTGWENHIKEITKWVPWEYTKTQIEKAKNQNKKLPEVELGRFYWQPSWAPNYRIPIVVKRTKKDEDKQTTLFQDQDWIYYGVVTNASLFQHSFQYVIEKHNKRGNCENFIREDKYGLDLKHFPCLKLNANYAFGLIAQVAHNILRWVAIIEKPHKPHFSKKLRRRFIYIPGKVVKHARQLIMKIPVRYHEEVERLKQAWTLKPCPSLGYGYG